MGKCISKNPTSLTIALSEKDLARASHILSKFTESSEYIALKDEHRNQLCEYFAANNTCGGQALAPPPNAEVVVIQTTSISHRTQEPSSYRDECGPGCSYGGKEQEKEQRHWQPTNEENTCLQSLDRETAANYRELKELEHCWPKIASHNCSNKGNDAFENNDDDDATIITAPSPQRRNDNDNGNGNEKDVIVSAVDGDRYTEEAGIVESANSCHSNCSRNKYFTSNTINNDNNNHLANNNNNPDDNNNNNSSSNSDNRGTSDNNNYYADVPQYLAQLILYHQSKQRPDITIHSSGTSTTTTASVAAEAGDHLQRREAKKTSKSKKAKLKKSKGCNSFDYVLVDEGNADAVVVSWSFRINLCCALWSN